MTAGLRARGMLRNVCRKAQETHLFGKIMRLLEVSSWPCSGTLKILASLSYFCYIFSRTRMPFFFLRNTRLVFFWIEFLFKLIQNFDRT